ncbi:uncharacterized protein [Miscanthus floridulus]|uniref:uncharacterized protein n=1 Tax=Miscanthus floridulus TaxID=154761 RepID=UPI00345A1DBE
MSSGQLSPMESRGGACPHGDDAPGASSSKKLWRGMQAVYLVLIKKHQPKLAALGIHLHSLLSSSKRRGHRRRSSLAAREREENPALMYLSCRSMDPAAAVVHPYPRGHGHRRASSSSSRHAAPSLSCRSMDPATAVCKYQYRPREVEFSCKSTPMHKRRRENKRRLRLQSRAAAADQGHDHDHPSSEPEHYYGSAAAVTRLFALMDVEEVAEGEAADVVGYYDDGDLDLDLGAAAVGSAPRQVRITDSPYLARDEDNEELRSAVDRRADEFIMWFHEQLRTQQQQRSTRNWVR